MDTLTRYYLVKANLKNQDQFYDHIEYSDIDTLNKAVAYCFVAPVGTFFFIYCLKSVQENGGMSRHFRSWASMARQWSGSQSDTHNTTWDDGELKRQEKPVYQDLKQQAKQQKSDDSTEGMEANLPPVQKSSSAQSDRPNVRMVRNSNPFERKRRLAMGEKLNSSAIEDFQKHGAAKNTRSTGYKKPQMGATASEYLRHSDQIYRQEYLSTQSKDFMHQQLNKNHMTAQHVESTQTKQYAPKLQTWLKNRQFGGVLTKFTAVRQSNVANRRLRFMIYAVPVTFSTIGAFSNLFNQSLTIYLRYQAMVDENYHRRMRAAEERNSLSQQVPA